MAYAFQPLEAALDSLGVNYTDGVTVKIAEKYLVRCDLKEVEDLIESINPEVSSLQAEYDCAFEKQVLQDLERHQRQSETRRNERRKRLEEYEKRKADEAEKARKEAEERALEDERQRLAELEAEKERRLNAESQVAAAAAAKAAAASEAEEKLKNEAENEKEEAEDEAEWRQFEQERLRSDSCSQSHSSRQTTPQPNRASQGEKTIVGDEINCDNQNLMSTGPNHSPLTCQLQPGVEMSGNSDPVISPPDPISKPITAKSSQPVKINFSDFEAEADVFADMELKTINDFAELQSILGGGNNNTNVNNASSVQQANATASQNGRLASASMVGNSLAHNFYPTTEAGTGQQPMAATVDQRSAAGVGQQYVYNQQQQPQQLQHQQLSLGSVISSSSSSQLHSSQMNFQGARSSESYPRTVSNNSQPQVFSQQHHQTMVAASANHTSTTTNSNATNQPPTGYPNNATFSYIHQPTGGGGRRMPLQQSQAYYPGYQPLVNGAAPVGAIGRPYPQPHQQQVYRGQQTTSAASSSSQFFPSQQNTVQQVRQTTPVEVPVTTNSLAASHHYRPTADWMRARRAEAEHSRSKSSDRTTTVKLNSSGLHNHSLNPKSNSTGHEGEEEPQEGELKPSRSVGDLISQLQAEKKSMEQLRRKNVQTPPPPRPASRGPSGLEDWVPWPKIGGAEDSPAIAKGEARAEDRTNSLIADEDLSEADRRLCGQLAEMGFPRSRLVKAARCFGGDSQKLINYCVLVDKLVDEGWKESDILDIALLHQSDEMNSRKHLEGFRKLGEFGFESQAIHRALIESGQDYQKALEQLIK